MGSVPIGAGGSPFICSGFCAYQLELIECSSVGGNTFIWVC